LPLKNLDSFARNLLIYGWGKNRIESERIKERKMNENEGRNGKEIKVKVKGYKAARNQEEGVEAFAVFATEFGEFYHSYWNLKDAQSHIEYEQTRKLRWNGEMMIRKTGEPILDQIIPWKVRSVTNQKIEITGNDVGFQFARNRMGRRTVRRSVHNLRRETTESGSSILLGEVHWQGREFTVRHSLLRFWVFHEWIGFTDEQESKNQEENLESLGAVIR
jgi:hypothetical protein